MSKIVQAVSAALLASATMLVTLPTPASAQRYYPPRRLPPNDPSYGNVPNVPNEQGCVKWCFRDSNPCDPPEYKRADGRCEWFD